MKPIFPISLFCLVFFSGCDKKTNTDPPPKEKDYFTCNVNQSYFAAGCDDLFNSCFRAFLDTQKREFLLNCRSKDYKSITISLTDTNNRNINAGSFLVTGGKSGTAYFGNVAFYDDQHYDFGYHTDSVHQGILKVSFDYKKMRATGTFSFVARHDIDSTDTINVTNGKFSVECEIY